MRTSDCSAGGHIGTILVLEDELERRSAGEEIASLQSLPAIFRLIESAEALNKGDSDGTLC